MSVLARIEGLGVTYAGAARAALEGVTLDLARGETLAVIGESGSGKTTLARALAGLLPEGARQSGRIDWPGGPPAPGRGYGYVFQDPGASLDPVMSIGAQLVEVLRCNLALGRAEARARAQDLLARVSIPEPALALAAFPHQFSGGQKQRIAIALAIAASPPLLIADEPTSALDTVVQAEITALLRDLRAADGMTLVFVTHDVALASTLADRIAVFRGARLIEEGTAAEVVHAPRADYTRSLIAAHLDLAAVPPIGAAGARPVKAPAGSPLPDGAPDGAPDGPLSPAGTPAQAPTGPRAAP